MFGNQTCPYSLLVLNIGPMVCKVKEPLIKRKVPLELLSSPHISVISTTKYVKLIQICDRVRVMTPLDNSRESCEAHTNMLQDRNLSFVNLTSPNMDGLPLT